MGADGLVLFNRFYLPDFDLESLEVVPRLTLSSSHELLLRLHWAAIIYGRVRADLAITGGVHTGADALKAMMAGARVAMMTSALLQHGIERLTVVRDELAHWMEAHEYESITQMQGSMGWKYPEEILRMARLKRRVRHAAAVCGFILLSAASAAAQQSPTPQPPLPFAPDWALLAGWDVYVKKGCGQCHGVRSGSEGRSAPDLARIASGTGFFDLGAAIWNHLPLMGAKMREKGIERPTLTPLELSNVLAFIFTAQYRDETGNAKTGERLFTSKSCVQCHSVGGKGGNVGPALDSLKRMPPRASAASRVTVETRKNPGWRR